MTKSSSEIHVSSGNRCPVAIVGMACRFPGAEDLSAFWRELEAGANAVTEGVPGSGVGRVGELFPDASVQNEACRFGAFVDGIDRFDAAFFRISPVEAQLLDPQQRMMLETSWHALEDAGMDPDRLEGSRTGVYAGISNNDYRGMILGSSTTAEPSASLFSVTGTSLNTAIGRVAFALGLAGPAMAVDTACSSSLVALHQAVAELQRGDADMALAGGVQAILSGRLTELRGNAGMLSPDGQCKAFDASANGFVRGEGCGIVVLKRLSEAEADGDRIWAVIRGSAVNQDGASTGLTVPNGLAQERVIEEALSRAGVPPSEVDYLEAHGTGTEVGDPIEIHATAAVYGRGREPDRPLLIGSVKTNIGHLEPAAGVAGLIKVVLAMKRGVIPRHLHFRNPNPRMDWERLPLRVTSTATDWPLTSGRPPLAGVSSFGWSGTNAHVLVEGYGPPAGDFPGFDEGRSPAGSARPVAVSPPEPVADLPLAVEGLGARGPRLLPLSGKSGEALRDLAGRYLSWLDEHAGELASEGAAESMLADMAWTAGMGRSHFAHRTGVVFRDVPSLCESLAALAEAGPGPARRAASRVAFVFTGQGSQWVGMGENLYHSEPVARTVLDRCDAVLRQDREISLLDVIFGRAGAEGDLSDQPWTQPAIYAIECALTALWSSLGIRPDVVLGHSLGELAAAQAAGVFGLEEGLRFAAKRGELTATLPAGGAMAAVFAGVTQVESALEELNAASTGVELSIAACNGAHQVVSGPEEKIAAISERFFTENIRVSRLRTRHAFHSALMEPMLDELESMVAGMAIAPPSLTLVSNVTGRVLESGELLDGAYWRRHTRERVAFGPSIETLAHLGVDLVVEIGPQAVLGPMATLVWPDSTDGAGAPPALSSLLRPSAKVSEAEADGAFVAAVAKAYEAGLPVSFGGLFAGETRRRIPLPSYPFQRQRHWIEAPKRRRVGAGHPLLGVRHESPRGEVLFETELLASDPPWLKDHRVFGRLVAPGALYGGMAASAALAGRTGPVVVEDLQLHSPLVVPEEDSGDEPEGGRKVELVLDGSETARSRRVEIFSRGAAEEGWTLHAEGRVSSGAGMREAPARLDLEHVKAGLSPEDVSAYYRAKTSAGIDFGPAFRTIQALWCGEGEAVGEVVLPDVVDRGGLEVHPILLDGCFQVMSAARQSAGVEGDTTYLPFGWERLWLTEPLPERMVCHARLRESRRHGGAEGQAEEPPEVLAGDVSFYTPDGVELGGLSGYTVKRATRAVLLSATEGLKDLLYEIVWRDRALAGGMWPADFLRGPGAVADSLKTFPEYLAAEGVEAADRAASLADLERLSRSYALSALERLGWERQAGAPLESEDLRRRLEVVADHRRLFARLLRMLAEAGVLEAAPGGGFVVAAGSGDPLPDESLADPEGFAARLGERHPHGSNELGLLQACGGALAEVLQGRADPLELLFGGDGGGAAELYRSAPAAAAANRMLADAVAEAVSGLPEGRRLRVLEIGAGTGSATATVLPELPAGLFDYVFTDISAGFFSQAERRFGDSGAPIEYRVLDIEADPVAQGFDPHGYDLVIAANVLHATRDLGETLAHCRKLLAPSGQLMALEGLRGRGWQDLTFGLLDGWWRFADGYRPDHAMAAAPVWRRALADTGFEEVAVLNPGEPDGEGPLGSGVVIARGPARVTPPRGLWVLAADRGGTAAALAAELAARNQTVVLAGEAVAGGGSAEAPGVVGARVEPERRESWRSLMEGLPGDVPLEGVVHLAALDGHGALATVEELAADAKAAGASALALVQGLMDVGATPARGLWFVTRGAQVLARERAGELAGATLWGVGKVVAREAAYLQSRMIDLDPEETRLAADFVNELLFPDPETHIAYRAGGRQVARLVRGGNATPRLSLPEEPGWRLAPDAGGAIEGLWVEPSPVGPLEPGEVRVGVEAAGLNFRDVLRAMGALDAGLLGREMCGRILEVGRDVAGVAVGDRVVGLGFGTFGPEVATRAELVTPAPAGLPAAALATVPTAFVTAALAFELAGLKAGERVLIHAGAGGVGLAAVQLALAAGAEVFATASAPKQAYLRPLGVAHVFDSRATSFGEEILEATSGAGVDVVLNSLTGEGFIEASLSCLARGGRFVELARRDIWNEETMAAARPDVAYVILDLDAVKKEEPARVGAVLQGVMERLSAGELTPLPHSRWPMAEAGAAMEFMRSARHVGKLVLALPPLAGGRLREDRTYLVTGGLGGIGCAVAGWLADRGAGAIVLNGRRSPDAAAEEAIGALRERGVTVQVELADVTDAAAVDGMLARMDAVLPALGGVIHSVGVLSDRALPNQSWDRFEEVLWPKVLGAWHLHRATAGRELDLFVLFSSVTGVLGNAGQANHAAANAFLDQLAAHRRALGLPGQAISWGAWSGLGEAEEQRERIERQLAASGTGWITQRQGLQALDRLVRQDVASSSVMGVDWPVFADSHDGCPPFLEELVSVPADSSADAPSSPADLLSRLRETPAAQREGLLVAFLQQELQAVLRLPAAPAPSVGFFDLGMDSLMAVELRNRLNQAFAGQYVASHTIVFDYPNAASLSRHLAGELGEVGEPAVVQERRPPERRPRPRSEEDGIAIVGMACRFPGAADLSAFWRQLEAGWDAVTDGRRDSGSWEGVNGDPAAADAAYRRGAFVEGIDRFDAEFFGIVPIEARMMDPQQRMLLETSWQALEDAGIDPALLKGRRAGVYVGVGDSEYREVAVARGQDHGYLGTSGSVAVGRVGFALGLMGPAIPLNMTCASSLVAVHQAVAGLQRGEVELALAGGVNAVLSPALTRFLKEVGMLSASGRCHAFDASADGFVRGEGCGVLVLKKLSEAEAAGDRIWGVIRGTAVNQNGASAGLTVPNGPAQERVIEEALSRARIAPSEVDFLEAHGIGSALGDPIEVHAAAAVYGRGREAGRPLWIGSVKTNIGHLECAAGAAGLIKVVLAMKQGVIPGQLHFRNPNPHVDWDRLPVRVASTAMDWPLDPQRPPRAGVSAFGLSGTNAHVVVEGYETPEGATAGSAAQGPAGPPRPVAVSLPDSLSESVAPPPGAGDGFGVRGARVLPLSGKTGEALRELAERYLSWLDQRAGEFPSEGAAADPLLSDVAWTAGVGRSHFDHRAGVVFHDAVSLREGLKTVADGAARPDPAVATKVAFAYSGQGSQWAGMGRTLYESEPVVRAVLDRCDEVIREERGASLLDVMFGRDSSTGDLDDPAWTQPAVYALECGLTALWSSVGIRPSVAAGHDLGELAAAQAAGVFGLEEGLRLAGARGALLASLSGDHTSEPASGGLEKVLADVALARPSLVLVSGMTGRAMESGEILDGTYWSRQAREPVAFAECVRTLAALEVDVVVEIGPRAVLGPMVVRGWPEMGDADGKRAQPVMLWGLGRSSGDATETTADGGFVEAVAGAYAAGLEIAFAGLFAGEARRRISLPTYPFERRRYWVETRRRLPS